MLTRPDATCLRPIRPGDSLLGASAAQGRLVLQPNVHAMHRRRFGRTWRPAPNGTVLGPRDRLLFSRDGAIHDPGRTFRDPTPSGRAIHRPGDGLTWIGKAVRFVSVTTVCLSACALAGFLGSTLVAPDAFYYYLPNRNGSPVERELTDMAWKGAIEGRVPRRPLTEAQKERLRSAYGKARVQVPQWLAP